TIGTSYENEKFFTEFDKILR
ncbi:TPA: hypothetical protein ACHDVC_001644, partial [Campylobacter jejuni]